MTYTKRELYGNAKLTEQDVRNIRLRAKRGEQSRDLAREWGVSLETVRKLLRWDTYANVSEEGAGATAADWMKESTPEEAAHIKAAEARAIALFAPKAAASTDHAEGTAGGQASGQPLIDNALASRGTGSSPSAPHISLEELLKQTALREEAQGSPGLERLEREAARPEVLLDELEKSTQGGKT